MTFTQLQYFIAIAKTESMTKAAESLNIVQPALSRTIQRLEAELETTLFDRKGKAISLNENGKTFLQFAEQCVNSLNRVHNSFFTEDKDMSGSLSIGSMLESTWIRKAIVEFHKLYPNINLEFQRITQSSEAPNLDFVIGPSSYESSHLTDTLYSRELWHDAIALLISANHPFSRRSTIKLSDVAEFPFVCPLKTEFSNFSRRFFELAEFSPISLITTDDQNLVFEMVRQNQAVALLPEFGLPDEYKTDLKLLKLTVPEYIRHISLYWPVHKPFSTLKQVFHDFLVEYCQKHFNAINDD